MIRDDRSLKSIIRITIKISIMNIDYIHIYNCLQSQMDFILWHRKGLDLAILIKTGTFGATFLLYRGSNSALRSSGKGDLRSGKPPLVMIQPFFYIFSR